LSYMNSEHGDMLANINETGDWNDDIEAKFKSGLDKFKQTQTW